MPPEVSSNENGGSTSIELTALPPGTTSTNTSPWMWHPKLTVARLLIVVSTLGLGTAKAITSFHGDTIAPIALEWVAGVIVFYM